MTAMTQDTVPTVIRDEAGRPIGGVFRCLVRWNDLSQTEQAGVRFCDNCGQRVHLVKTTGDMLEAVAERRCVALAGRRRMHLGAPAAPYSSGGPLDFSDWNPSSRPAPVAVDDKPTD